MSDSIQTSSVENDPRMQRLQDVAELVRVQAKEGEDIPTLEQRVKNEIDALVSPLSDNRKKLIEVMRNPQKPLDQEVREWALAEVKGSLDQVKVAMERMAEIQELDPDFLDREFTSQGFDLQHAEETINTLNNDGRTVGGFPVRRDVRARLIFKAAFNAIAAILKRAKENENEADPEADSAALKKNAELARNLLSKKFIIKRDDPQNGWYE